ncbi:MAG: hypothetical protein H6838_12295 [Planctomycetes bacterium]|nr:hypothetical protein [Planctomycetota bacterium]
MQLRTRPFRRTRILVDRGLQWSLCLHCIAYGGLLLVLLAAAIFGPLLWQLGDRAPNNSYDPEVAVVMLYMHSRFWLIAAAGLLLIVVGALRFSHRIAGPLVRFKRNLRLIADGQLPPPLRTRDGDFLQEEVACLNRAVIGLSERVERARVAQAALRRELGAAADAARFGGGEIDVAALLAANEELQARLDEFRTIDDLDGYRIVPEAEFALQQASGGAPLSTTEGTPR